MTQTQDTTASKQLKPLAEFGIVERTEDGRHSVGWRLLTIASRPGDQRLLLLAPPVMRRLTQLLRERAHFSILRGGEVLTVLSESPRRTVEAVGWVGRTSPRTVEDLIARTHQAGVACAINEFDDDLNATAAPVRNVHGRITGALNVSAPSFRMQTNRSAVARSLIAAATHLSSLLTTPPESRADFHPSTSD